MQKDPRRDVEAGTEAESQHGRPSPPASRARTSTGQPAIPNLNAVAEPRVPSAREECLHQSIVLRERHVRYVLKEYVEYFMKRRPHQGLKQQSPDSRDGPPAAGCIRCRQVLGGLINDDYREAA